MHIECEVITGGYFELGAVVSVQQAELGVSNVARKVGQVKQEGSMSQPSSGPFLELEPS